jgi:hypothetical protein
VGRVAFRPRWPHDAASTLEAGGNVLIHVHASGVIYDVLELVSATMKVPL